VVVFVPPLIYQHPLFWIAIFLILVAFYFLLIRWKTHTVNQRNKLLSETVSKQTAEIETEKSQLAKALEKQKNLTHELNMTQTTKNRMYAQISHEFKSPLQAIKSHLSKSEGYLHGNDKERIKGNIDNLLSISNEIMELSKAESGNLKLKKNWYNINGVIADQVELKQQLAIEKGIRIEQISKIEKQYLEFDISLMQKVIGNLLSNAIKFSPLGGNIRIESVVSNNTQIIEITDQGPGIPFSEIKNITLAYYQASNNTEDGTGIGLSLVKEILKLHDSKLVISSKLSEGSTFGFTLKRPKISQEEIILKNINIAGLDSQINRIIDPSKKIILAVDDSEDVLFFIQQALSSRFYVITAKNGEEALDALKKIKPNAIISDFNMPIMNGIEFLKHVRKLPSFQIIPFLFLTGSSSEETELQSIMAGADLILQKPILEDILITQVSQLLRRQKNISASIKSSFVHDLLPTSIQNDDLILMKELESIFLENISNGKLTSQEIADMIGIGEKTLRNRVKSITGNTVKVYFRNFRLEKAKQLLAEGYGNMGEVAMATGFSSLSYFSKSYKAYFNPNAKG
jgi:signal transduction histidine kinase/DNA-binding response OmpR family regulator